MKKCFLFPNKKRYSTQKDAQTVVILQNINLKIYFCENCNGYHLAKYNDI